MLPPAVRAALSGPAVYHRGAEFENIFADVHIKLKTALKTKNPVLVFSASGTGGMEACVTNLLKQGDTALVIENGVFGRRFAEILQRYNIRHEVLAFAWGADIDYNRLEAILKKRGKTFSAVFFVHLETSTGVLNDINAIAALVKRYSPALCVCDAISSAAAEKLETDRWGLDAVITASHKGLMCAPGLSYVALSPAAQKASRTCTASRGYFDFNLALEFLSRNQTPFTVSGTLICAQAAALDLLLKEGLPEAIRTTAGRAALLRKGAQACGLELFGSGSASCGVTALVPFAGVSSTDMCAKLSENYGITVADGQLELKGRLIRIGNLGYISINDIKRLVRALAGLAGDYK